MRFMAGEAAHLLVLDLRFRTKGSMPVAMRVRAADGGPQQRQGIHGDVLVREARPHARKRAMGVRMAIINDGLRKTAPHHDWP